MPMQLSRFNAMVFAISRSGFLVKSLLINNIHNLLNLLIYLYLLIYVKKTYVIGCIRISREIVLQNGNVIHFSVYWISFTFIEIPLFFFDVTLSHMEKEKVIDIIFRDCSSFFLIIIALLSPRLPLFQTGFIIRYIFPIRILRSHHRYLFIITSERLCICVCIKLRVYELRLFLHSQKAKRQASIIY